MSALIDTTTELLPAPRDLDEAWRYAATLADSTLIPKDFQGKPHNVLIAMMWAKNLGLPMLMGLQSIAVINGRPTIWGDTAKALVLASGLCEDFTETFDADKGIATCTIKRKGYSKPTVVAFSMKMAEQAGLTKKDGPWRQYPARMCQLRARGFAIRDAFPDLLRGLHSAEEEQDTVLDAPQSAPAADPAPAKKAPRRNSAKKAAPVEDIAETKPAAIENNPSPAIEEVAPPAPAREAEPIPAAPAEADPPSESMFEEDPPKGMSAEDLAQWIARIDACETVSALGALYKQMPREVQNDLFGEFSRRKVEINPALERKERPE